jgi:hypothetical protein
MSTGFLIASSNEVFINMYNIFFFEKGYAQPLHRTDAYDSLLTYSVAVSSIITSLCVAQGGHMNQPSEK